MKKLFLILLLFFLSLNIAISQTMYPSPQTVVWDSYEDPPTVGIIEYEVYLIPLPESRLIALKDRETPQKHIYLNRTPIEEIIVDIRSANLEGDFIVAVRTVYYLNDHSEASEFAYSDRVEDLHPEQKPFFLRYVKGVQKPKMILFNDGS